MPEWSPHRILFYAGLFLMIGSWVAGIMGAMIAVTLSSAYNATCTSQPPPLTTPVGCPRLAAQVSQAATVALLGGVVGFVGMVLAILGKRGV